MYVGRIGTGYGAQVAGKLLPTLQKLTRENSPFGGQNAPPKEKNIRWLKPTLVAEIEFAGWTATGMIRQASFKGLRRDKPASEVVSELPSPVDVAQPSADLKLVAKVKGRTPRKADATPTSSSRSAPTGKGVTSVMGVTLSHADKVLWPSIKPPTLDVY